MRGIDAVPTQMDYGELVSLDAQCPHLDNVFGPAGLHSPSTLRHLASWSSWTYAVLYDLFCIHIGHPNPLGMHAVELLDIFQRVLGGQDSVLREWPAVRPCVPEFLGRPLAHVGRGGTAAAAASSAGPNIGPENASLRSAGRSVFFSLSVPQFVRRFGHWAASAAGFLPCRRCCGSRCIPIRVAVAARVGKASVSGDNSERSDEALRMGRIRTLQWAGKC